jgi:hypothetical protein
LERGPDGKVSRSAQREDQNTDAAIYEYDDFSTRFRPQGWPSHFALVESICQD